MKIVEQNLREAINGESNAKHKYELFAEQAKKEGLTPIAKIFDAISQAESIHIKNHLKALSHLTNGEINVNELIKIDEEELKSKMRNTRDNLKNAIEGELYETKKMYKGFIKNSIKEQDSIAELSFTLARKAEKVHAKIFTKFLRAIEKEKQIECKDIFVCQICGNVELNKAPSICPICEHGKKFFKKI